MKNQFIMIFDSWLGRGMTCLFWQHVNKVYPVYGLRDLRHTWNFIASILSQLQEGDTHENKRFGICLTYLHYMSKKLSPLSMVAQYLSSPSQGLCLPLLTWFLGSARPIALTVMVSTAWHSFLSLCLAYNAPWVRCLPFLPSRVACSPGLSDPSIPLVSYLLVSGFSLVFVWCS